MHSSLRRLLSLSVIARGSLAVPVAPMSTYYRADGVRITHDPYSPGMAEKYGKPGATDNEGFDPYADSVGAGIYGGRVRRDKLGAVVIGKQYQDHNSRPGPVYGGGGYTPVNQALKSTAELTGLLSKFPDLVNDVSTGGATPLHMCGMSQQNQHATKVIIEHGGDIEALDSYGMTPLHRMASNNLAEGARALLMAGADPESKGGIGDTPLAVAKGSAARDVIQVLQKYAKPLDVPISTVTVIGAGMDAVNGVYEGRDGAVIPDKFALVCEQNSWDTTKMWKQLSGAGSTSRVLWFEGPNGCYIYFNVADGHWWMDGPDGLGVYKALSVSSSAVPGYPRGSGGRFGWFPMDEANSPVPSIAIHRQQQGKEAEL